MKTGVILFDLDGTLLPMDQDTFIKAYLGRLAKKLAYAGYTDTKRVVAAVMSGTEAMIANDGGATNEDRFWERFESLLGSRIVGDKDILDDFYRNEFEQVQESCGYNPEAARTVKALKERGFRVSLATNPLFPQMATESRLRWSGVSRDDVEWLGSYENSHYCKPNLDYYTEITEGLGVDPRECLMVGNDVGEDMVAERLGMKVFLLTDCLINKKNEDIDKYPHGSFADLIRYVDGING